MTRRNAPTIYLLGVMLLCALALCCMHKRHEPKCTCTLGYKGPSSTYQEYADGVRDLDAPEDCPRHGPVAP